MKLTNLFPLFYLAKCRNLIVSFTSSTNKRGKLQTRNLYEVQDTLSKLETKSEDQNPRNRLSINYLKSLDMAIIKFSQEINLTDSEILEIMKGIPEIKFAEFDEFLGSQAEKSPEKNLRIQIPRFKFEDFSEQWNLEKTEKWGINLPKNITKNTESPIIALIDSGCKMEFPGLKESLWKNPGEWTDGICPDGIDNDENGFVDDCYGWDFADDDNNPESEESGHGTGSAAIIAYSNSNFKSICPNCIIMCLRFISNGRGLLSSQIAAINYALDNGAKISNNSYGGSKYMKSEFEAIKRALEFNHIFVTSSGNENRDTDIQIHTPSGYDLPNIVSVGAASRSGFKTRFSNWGQNSVDIFAPGEALLIPKTAGKIGFEYVMGTSFASSQVAGAVGLLWSQFPHFAYHEILETLYDSCKKNKFLNNLCVCGGVLDIGSAIEMLEEKQIS
eukprot:GHVP01021369.1.p1 GENE.GHVP01021369.1~~GHVP01021369.1.p1  ORF type:complete len:445 (+),score=89.97 GHVP01021369.1:123-1457(+)